MMDYQLTDQVFLIVEYAQQGTLLEEIKKNGFFSEKLARYYFKQLLEGIETMHLNNVFHRDLKMENIVLDKNFQLKIIDFGYACDSNAEVTGLKGSLSYVPPQAFNMNSQYKPSAQDLFALGVCLFIMKIGFFPFQKATKTNQFYKHIYSEDFHIYWKIIQKNTSKNSVFSEDFKDLIEKMLAVSEEERLSLEQLKQHPWVLKDAYNSVEDVLREYKTRYN